MEIFEEQLRRESIRRGFVEMEAGHYIPHEAMKAWLLSLGSDHELAGPKCICGESHDGPCEDEGRKGGPLGPPPRSATRIRGFSS
jgi:hypothetical protein